MCRGGEESQTEVVERAKVEARWPPSDHSQFACGQLTPPKERCLALPARALRSRMSSHSSPPTWAAWLPRDMHSDAQSTSTESSWTVQSGGTDSSWAIDPALQNNMEACESESLMPADPQIGYGSAGGEQQQQQLVYFLQPVYVPVEDVMPAGDNVQLVGFDGWTDPSNTCMYYPDQQLGECYGQLEQPVCQGDLSMGPLTGKVWQLSKDANGCRQVQDAFDNAGCDEERVALASELVGHVWEALKCMHANHVLQKSITTNRPDVSQFVIDELTQHGAKGITQAARHRFGCRILQRLLEHCTEDQMSFIVEILFIDAVDLSSHTYGHYVMQHLFEQCNHDVVSRLSCSLQQHLPNMIADGYIGAVIGKALNHTNNEACVSLAASLLQEHAHMVVMACSRWGYLAIKQALQLVSTSDQDKAFAELMRCQNKLRSSRYGRLVATFVTELQSLASA